MSHATADTHDADPGDHEAHAEPADELAPDEPKTPVWLTALGGALFLLLAIVWLAAGSTEAGEVAPAASASATAVAAPPTPPPPPPTVVPPPPLPPPTPPAVHAPAGPGARPAASSLPRYPRPKGVKQ